MASWPLVKTKGSQIQFWQVQNRTDFITILQPLTSAHNGKKSADGYGKRSPPSPSPVLRPFPGPYPAPDRAPLPSGCFPEPPRPPTPRMQGPGQSSAPLPAGQFWGLEGGRGALRTPGRIQMTLELGPLCCSPKGISLSPCSLRSSSTLGTLSPTPDSGSSCLPLCQEQRGRSWQTASTCVEVAALQLHVEVPFSSCS